MAIQEAKQQHPDMLVTKAVVIRETESPTEEMQHRAQVRDAVGFISATPKTLRVFVRMGLLGCWSIRVTAETTEAKQM